MRGIAEPSEALRVERLLAIARLVFAVVAFLAIWLDPTEPTRYIGVAYGLLVFFVMYSLVVLLWLRIVPAVPAWFSFTAHGIDVEWVAGILSCTEGPNSPFFTFLMFILLEAAYRWGLPETLWTVFATEALLVGEALVLAPAPRGPAYLFSPGFDLNRFILRASYLILAGFLLGYLAEGEKQLRAEVSVIERLVRKAQVRSGLRGTIRAILEELLRIFQARAALLVAREGDGEGAYLWEARRDDPRGEFWLAVRDIEPSELGAYSFPPSARSFWMRNSRAGGTPSQMVLGPEGRRGPPLAPEAFEAISAAEPFESLASVSFSLPEELSGRLFLLDPRPGAGRESELQFLQRVADEVSPAIHNVMLLRRLRSRAGALERGRIARELHDGAIQSLLAAEIEVNQMRQHDEPARADSLEQVERLLHQQALNLREMMEMTKPLDFHPRELDGVLADLVEKFRRETGIEARFVAGGDDLKLSPPVCREVVRIVQEGLVNVRKHSAARRVEVLLEARDGRCRLVIEDDGRGFGFSGILGYDELERTRQGPRVVKERVRFLGGELTLESNPGHGARLEIVFPQERAIER
ncbi:MAG TPA: ATP-binding protein [Candidatus Acidoferrales bacterium]|nr:ATP-binding protein [Candidatus Acidoferrales bacterium]